MRGVYFSEKVTVQFWSAVHKGQLEIPKFSEQEISIMKLCYSGLSYKMIADKLDLSINAIKGSMDNMYKKLKIHTRIELLKFAVENGIVLLDS